MGNTVTLVSGIRVQPGSEDEHRRLHDVGVCAARSQGGLAHAELIPALPGVQEDTIALLTFTDRRHLDVWLASTDRANVLSQMSTIAVDRNLNVVSGFPGWFHGRENAVPPRWKQAVVVIAALIPVSYAVAEIRELVAPQLPTIAVVALSAVANVCVLTWAVMPPVNKALARWLLT